MASSSTSGTAVPPTGPVKLDGIKSIVMDIEGTICSISFVKEELYPYSLAALPAEMDTYFSLNDDGETRASSPLAPYVAAFPEDVRHNQDSLLQHVHDLVKRDVKDTALKKLQGYLWKAGFESGELAAPLFPDVEPAWRRWSSSSSGDDDTESKGGQASPSPSFELAIYSSGSVDAQKMLLSHVRSAPVPDGVSEESSRGGQEGRPTTSTNLLHLFSHFFDTENAGPKVESRSYRKIVDSLAKEPAQVLFLSDNPAEIRAALEAGLRAVLVQRPGNADLSDRDREELDVVYSFDQLELTN